VSNPFGQEDLRGITVRVDDGERHLRSLTRDLRPCPA
jgi:hypothetical protein